MHRLAWNKSEGVAGNDGRVLRQKIQWVTYVEAEVVVEERPTGIDHFDVVQFILVHGLKYRDFRLNPPKIQFGSLVWIHAVELPSRLVSMDGEKGPISANVHPEKRS